MYSWEIFSGKDVYCALVLAFLGRRLRALYHKRVCGGVLLPVTSEGDKSAIAVRMAFQSATRRFSTTIIFVFAVSAVLVAMLGICSESAFSVASRTQEMAIRMALESIPNVRSNNFRIGDHPPGTGAETKGAPLDECYSLLVLKKSARLFGLLGD